MTRILAQSRAANHDNAVVFACDDGHLPFALFAADRIRRTEPEGKFDIVICMPDISNVTEHQKAGPARFCQIDFAALPDVPMVKAWITNATYFRWVLPSAFVEEYRTLFYLDTDTYLARAGLQRVFDGITAPVALAAVEDFHNFVTVDDTALAHYTAKIKDLGGENGEYWNAGVLVYQPKAFLEMDGLKRFVMAAQENVQFLPIHHDQDQGAMNLAFADDIVALNPLYNWRSRAWLHQREVDKYNPYVLHFAGRAKPWHLQDDPYIDSFSEEYLCYLAEEFPEFTPKAALKSGAWRYENPKHKIKLFEDIRVALHKRRFHKKMLQHWNRDYDAKIPKMDAAIKRAVVG